MTPILYLGPPSPLIDFLERGGDRVESTEDDVNGITVAAEGAWLISYGYRHILRRPTLDLFAGRAVNLHISFLPWNRGADPNLWSWVDGTPKGVTIHHLDEGIDTGDIITQRRVEFTPHDTLATSYAKLRADLELLFMETWPAIKAGTAPRIPQPKPPRRTRDRAAIAQPRGWDTPVTAIAASS